MEELDYERLREIIREEIAEKVGKIDLSKITVELREIIKEELTEAGFRHTELELGDKWIGGELILKPNSKDLQEKSIPIERFFHKIVTTRERLRVLEAKINSNAKLSDEDKVELQQYITKIYGTLTTFNLLFRKKTSWFVGEGGKDV